MELVKRLGAKGCPCRLDFLWLASYQGTSSTGNVRLLADLQSSIEGETVLLVDDLIDTGLTMAESYHHLNNQAPKAIETLVVMEKLEVPRTALAVGLKMDYVGFQIPPKFIVGAFTDYNEHFRSVADVIVFDSSKKSTLKGGMEVTLLDKGALPSLSGGLLSAAKP